MQNNINKTNDKNELWFNWLSRKVDSYEAFNDFESGMNPLEVAESFVSANNLKIIEIFEKFDKEDKEALDQLQKLTEFESHVFRMIQNKLKIIIKVRYVDFKKENK